MLKLDECVNRARCSLVLIFSFEQNFTLEKLQVSRSANILSDGLNQQLCCTLTSSFPHTFLLFNLIMLAKLLLTLNNYDIGCRFSWVEICMKFSIWSSIIFLFVVTEIMNLPWGNDEKCEWKCMGNISNTNLINCTACEIFELVEHSLPVFTRFFQLQCKNSTTYILRTYPFFFVLTINLPNTHVYITFGLSFLLVFLFGNLLWPGPVIQSNFKILIFIIFYTAICNFVISFLLHLTNLKCKD